MTYSQTTPTTREGMRTLWVGQGARSNQKGLLSDRKPPQAKAYPNVPVWGGSDKIPKLTQKIGHGDSFSLTKDSSIQVSGHATPCHTQDSVCFMVQDKADGDKKGVFTG